VSSPAFQQVVAEFVAAHQLEAPPEIRVLDLVSEVGEVAKEVLKGSAYGQQPFRSTEEWAGELADCFFSLICLANGTGVNLEAEVAEVLAKYQRRLRQTGGAGSGR